jgi:hypothetical protein
MPAKPGIIMAQVEFRDGAGNWGDAGDPSRAADIEGGVYRQKTIFSGVLKK